MDAVMYISRLEVFTPEVVLEALEKYMSRSDWEHLKISTEQLNLIRGPYDYDFKKYVISIGDGIYQIVAIDRGEKRKVVTVKYSQLSGIRGYIKEEKMELKDFSEDKARAFFEECLHEKSARPPILNRIQNGILDSNIVKYVISEAYMLYQIAAIENNGITSLILKSSQV